MSVWLLTLPLALSRAPLDHIGERPAPITQLAEAPAPVDEPLEMPRRQFELGGSLGPILPTCPVDSGDACSGVSVGQEWALYGFWRVTPHFGFGPSVRMAHHSATASDHDWQGIRRSSLFALSGRVYPLGTTRFDPYLQLDMGAGALSLDVLGVNGRSEDMSLGLAARSALGLDVAVTSWFHAGGFVAYWRYLPSSVTRCVNECSNIAAGDSSLALGSVSLGLELGFTFGEML
ncbi:MAG: hypothetical protein QM756_21315 [Polyangiaceae bacterium]